MIKRFIAVFLFLCGQMAFSEVVYGESQTFALGGGSTRSMGLPHAQGRVVLSAAPNPFHPETRITVSGLSVRAAVSLSIFSADGRKIMELSARASSAAGELRAVWRGRDHEGKSVPPGIYFVKLESGPRALVLKLVYCR